MYHVKSSRMYVPFVLHPTAFYAAKYKSMNKPLEWIEIGLDLSTRFSQKSFLGLTELRREIL